MTHASSNTIFYDHFYIRIDLNSRYIFVIDMGIFQLTTLQPTLSLQAQDDPIQHLIITNAISTLDVPNRNEKYGLYTRIGRRRTPRAANIYSRKNPSTQMEPNNAGIKEIMF